MEVSRAFVVLLGPANLMEEEQSAALLHRLHSQQETAPVCQPLIDCGNNLCLRGAQRTEGPRSPGIAPDSSTRGRAQGLHTALSQSDGTPVTSVGGPICTGLVALPSTAKHP